MLDWEKYIAVAERFQGKARYEDREDLKHNIILALAGQGERNRRNGNKPLTEFGMLRIASHTVADYYRQLKRNGKVVSLNAQIEDRDGDSLDLGDTLADDKAMDLDAWVDARVWLLGCPKRLIQIAHKRVNGMALDNAEMVYLCKWRKKAQKRLF